MRSFFVPAALAALLLVAGLAAQSCVNVCASSNWGSPLRAARFTPTTIAIRVPGLATADVLCQIEFFCSTRSSQPVQMPVWIYDRAPSGAPGSPLGAGTMLVGTTAAAYSASIQAPVGANADFFIVFDNATGNLNPPVAGRGNSGSTPQEHWHSGPPTWTGPFTTGQFIYRVFCSSGTVPGGFATTGGGCAGRAGVPRIGGVGSPVLGSTFQVTLAGAPSGAASVFMIGLGPQSVRLDTLGAPGCVIELLPFATESRRTGSTGATSFPFFLPNDPSIVGARVLGQWAVVDPPANALGITVSPGGVLTIGDF